MKSRHSSKAWYKKYSKAIKMRRWNKYSEPSAQATNRLIIGLQDKFYKSKSIVKKILTGYEKLSTWNKKATKV